MVVVGGFEPPMFTAWVEVLQTSLFGRTTETLRWLLGWDSNPGLSH